MSITLDLSERVEAALVEISEEDGVSSKEVIARALDDFLFIRNFRRLRETMRSQSSRDFTDEEIFESVS